VATGTLALGLAGLTPVLLARADIYEVAISCGYALTMLTLLALWAACHRPDQRGRWLAAASLAYGLAIGARPNLLFGAVILLVPVVQAWREGSPRCVGAGGGRGSAGATAAWGTEPVRQRRGAAGRRIWAPLLAATGPITCIGLGLMLYNILRFDNPLEFGIKYELSSIRMSTEHLWSPHYLGFNSWVYFLGPARWSARFPFVHDINLPPRSADHVNPEHPFGVLTSIPLVWLALAAPLAWRSRSAEARSTLRGFLAAVALFFATCALNLSLYFAANVRYEMEFCPALVLLATVGILGLERTLAGWPAWRRATRGAWSASRFLDRSAAVR
jgi:hypothetical protein